MVPPTTEADLPAAEAADEHDVEPSTSPAGSGAVIAVTVAAAVFALLAVGMAVVAVHYKSEAGDANSDDRTTVATTASRAAEAMTSLDADGPNQEQADIIRQLGTTPFIEQYEQGIEAIRKLFGPLKVKSERGQVTRVYVGDIDQDQAEVIVVVDLVLVAEIPKVVPNQYLRVHLAKLSGVWKVDNVEDLNVALAASVGSTPEPVTPTSGTESSSG